MHLLATASQFAKTDIHEIALILSGWWNILKDESPSGKPLVSGPQINEVQEFSEPVWMGTACKNMYCNDIEAGPAHISTFIAMAFAQK